MSGHHLPASTYGSGRALRLAICAALLAAISGCGSAPEVKIHGSPATPSTAAAVADDADLVSAVKDANGELPLALRYDLQQRPAPGGDFSLRLRFEAAQPVRGIRVRYELPAGLSWAAAAPEIRDAAIAEGGHVDRTLRLRSGREGVMALRVIAAVEITAGRAATAAFSIPLIVEAPAGAVSRP
jgi:hypothetical protein